MLHMKAFFLEQECFVLAWEWVLGAGVRVSLNKVLKNELRILEIRGLVVISLSVDSSESFLEVFEPIDESLDI